MPSQACKNRALRALMDSGTLVRGEIMAIPKGLAAFAFIALCILSACGAESENKRPASAPAGGGTSGAREAADRAEAQTAEKPEPNAVAPAPAQAPPAQAEPADAPRRRQV